MINAVFLKSLHGAGSSQQGVRHCLLCQSRAKLSDTGYFSNNGISELSSTGETLFYASRAGFDVHQHVIAQMIHRSK